MPKVVGASAVATTKLFTNIVRILYLQSDLGNKRDQKGILNMQHRRQSEHPSLQLNIHVCCTVCGDLITTLSNDRCCKPSWAMTGLLRRWRDAHPSVVSFWFLLDYARMPLNPKAATEPKCIDHIAQDFENGVRTGFLLTTSKGPL